MDLFGILFLLQQPQSAAAWYAMWWRMSTCPSFLRRYKYCGHPLSGSVSSIFRKKYNGSVFSLCLMPSVLPYSRFPPASKPSILNTTF
jgi:hypothetical protein